MHFEMQSDSSVLRVSEQPGLTAIQIRMARVGNGSRGVGKAARSVASADVAEPESPNHPVADEVAKEQTGGKGKAGKSTEKGGKPGGKAGGKGAKRKREGKGDAEPTPNKKKKADVECFNCGEKGHYKNQCRKPLRITDGSGDADE
jgi:hypothetical protein